MYTVKRIILKDNHIINRLLKDIIVKIRTNKEGLDLQDFISKHIKGDKITKCNFFKSEEAGYDNYYYGFLSDGNYGSDTIYSWNRDIYTIRYVFSANQYKEFIMTINKEDVKAVNRHFKGQGEFQHTKLYDFIKKNPSILVVYKEYIYTKNEKELRAIKEGVGKRIPIPKGTYLSFDKKYGFYNEDCEVESLIKIEKKNLHLFMDDPKYLLEMNSEGHIDMWKKDYMWRPGKTIYYELEYIYIDGIFYRPWDKMETDKERLDNTKYWQSLLFKKELKMIKNYRQKNK